MNNSSDTRLTTGASIFLLLNGVALVWYEAIFNNFDRPWLLGLAGAMIGVAPVKALDTLLQQRKGE